MNRALSGLVLMFWPALVLARKSTTGALVLIALILIGTSGRKLSDALRQHLFGQVGTLTLVGLLWCAAGAFLWSVEPESGRRNLLQMSLLSGVFWVAWQQRDVLALMPVQKSFVVGMGLGWAVLAGWLIWFGIADVPEAMGQADARRDWVKSAEAGSAALVLAFWIGLARATTLWPYAAKQVTTFAIVVSGGLVFAASSLAAQVAWVAGMLVYALASVPILSRALMHLTFVAGIVTLLMTPWIVKAGLDLLPDNTGHSAVASRVIIFQESLARIDDRPLTGWGVEGSRYFTPGGPGNPKIIREGAFNRGIYTHPHSFFLQIWLELGAVGAVLVAGGMTLNWRAVLGSGSDRARTIASTTIAALVLGNVTYGLWQEWIWSLAFVLTLLWWAPKPLDSS